MSVNPKDQAARSEGKARLDLLEPAANEGAARALEFGAITKSYGIQNYKLVSITYRTYLAAVQRHLDALKRGEDIAPDSGLSHWDHILANGHVFKGAEEAGTLVDDRGPGEVGDSPVNVIATVEYHPPRVTWDEESIERGAAAERLRRAFSNTPEPPASIDGEPKVD